MTGAGVPPENASPSHSSVIASIHAPRQNRSARREVMLSSRAVRGDARGLVAHVRASVQRQSNVAAEEPCLVCLIQSYLKNVVFALRRCSFAPCLKALQIHPAIIWSGVSPCVSASTACCRGRGSVCAGHITSTLTSWRCVRGIIGLFLRGFAVVQP